MVVANGEPPTLADENKVKPDYAGSDEINSRFLTNEDELAHDRPKYSKFNKEFDMNNPQFKIGMKFRSFKQFKETVKNYGIRNRYVMNFKSNSKKRCKAFCKRGCPFYLWASPMVKDKNIV